MTTPNVERLLVALGAAVAIAFLMVVSLAVLLLFTVARGAPEGHRELLRIGFFAGLLCLLGAVTLSVLVFFSAVGVGFDLATIVVLCLLAIETGLTGWLGLQSPWRFFSLSLVVIGLLPLISVFLRRR